VSDVVADAATGGHTTCPPLPKSLARRDVFFFLLCTLVGLDTLGSVAAHGGQGFFWLVFLAILFFVPYALCIAELGSTFPEEGGVYVWTRLALGRPVAALTAVFYWVSNPIYLGGALTTTAMATWSTFFFELGSIGKVVFGLLLIWGCVFATVISLRYARWISAFGAGARIVILTLFTFSVAVYAYVHGIHGIRVPELAPTMDGFAAVVPLLVFNFVGFELPSSAAGEMVDAQRDVPRAIMRSGVASVLCYGIPILAIVLVLPTDKITGLKGFVDAMQLVFTVYGGHVSRAPDGTEIVVLEGAGKVLGSVAALGFIVALATSGVAWIIGADRTQAVACLALRAHHRSRAHELRGAHREQCSDHRHERHRVQDEAVSGTHRDDEHTGKRGPQDAGDLENGAVETDGVGQLVGLDHLRDERLPSRIVEHLGEAVEDDDRVDHPQFDGPGEGERRQHDGDDRHGDLRDHQHHALVEPVGDDAAPHSEQERGQELQRDDKTDRERAAVRQLQHQPAQRDGLHPGATQRHHLAEEEQPVVARA